MSDTINDMAFMENVAHFTEFICIDFQSKIDTIERKTDGNPRNFVVTAIRHER